RPSGWSPPGASSRASPLSWPTTPVPAPTPTMRPWPPPPTGSSPPRSPGLSRDGVVSVAGSPSGAAMALLERLLRPDHELVTVIEGEGATAGDTRRVTEWLHDQRPDVVAEVHHGGQPLYPYLLGIE